MDLSNLSDAELEQLAKSFNKPKSITSNQRKRVDITKDILSSISNIPNAIENTARSVAKHPGQAVAGIIPGITSIADIPGLLFNTERKAYQDLKRSFGNKEYTASQIPAVGHEFGTDIANAIAGMPQTQEEQQARLGGEFAGSFIAPGTIAKNSTKGIRGLAKVSPEKYQAFKKAGISPTLGEVTTSIPTMRTEQALKNTPITANVFEGKATVREKELDNLFKEHAKLEEALSPYEAGELQKQGAKAYNEKATGVANKLYDRAFSNIDPKARVPMEKTLGAIDEALAAESVEAREILQKSNAGKKLIELEEAIKNHNGSLPLGDLRKVYRKTIDDMINTWGQIGNNEQGILKKIRSTLDNEVKDYIVQTKPGAAKDFEKADKFWAGFNKRNKNITNKAIKSESPVQVFNQTYGALKRGDVEPAQVIMQRLPEKDKTILSSTYMNELGRGTGGEFDANKWAREFTKLRPESRKVITAGLEPQSAKKLDFIAKALEHSKLNKGQANHSGTAYTAALMGIPFTAWYAPVTTAIGAGTAYGASKLFTSPKVIDHLYKASKLKTPGQLNKYLSKQSVLPRIEVVNEKRKELEFQDQENESKLEQLSLEQLEELANSFTNANPQLPQQTEQITQ